ncbi:Hemicentin-2 [Stylophora pistillata]|uniref:Hemicentin-2 n=1 Tax=Stylophora pistillata TaxID=50429 RepID=A0A2B4R8P6_STYPI|nr:Hemicentin-2 [Stylophora pistillata]
MSSCHEEFPLRFTTEGNPSVGTMEIYTNSSWQKLCISNWNKAEEDLMCMAMGYSNSSYYGRWYEDSDNESETSINYNCTTILTKCGEHFSNKLQLCKVAVRLNGANVEYGRRVEVFYKGKWGKICANGWDFNDVKVICRQLGFEEALAEFIGSDVEGENITTVIFDVSCTGNEVELASCTRSDGKLHVPGQCQGDGKGSQALCQPKNKQVMGKKELFFDIGSNENLHCSILNKTSFARWIINGKKMQNTTSPSERVQTKKDGELVIENVQLSDGGTYECHRMEYVQYYTVYINARFTENTQGERSLTADKFGIINCNAEGKPPPQITWSKQGRNLLLNGGRFSQMPSGSLRIDPVQPEDNGTYICTMKQNKGPTRVTSAPKNILVSVIVRPELNVSGASNLIREGDNVTLTCKIIQVPPQLDSGLKNHSVTLNSTFTTPCFVKGSPPVSVNWSKDGEALVNNNTLIIKHVTFDDKGFYECVAENLAGKANSSFWIDVTVSPWILLSPVNQSVIVGDPVNFTCRASGVPTPKVMWTFNSGKLQSGINQINFERDLFVESYLEMLRTTKEMEGTYECTAENKANTTSSSATLQVFEKPTVELSPKPYPTLTSGDELRLTCIVNKATVNISWKKDGDKIKKRADIFTQLDEKKGYLHIAKVVEEDSGVYSCEARNRLGNVARSNVTINVNFHPILIMEYLPCGDLLGYMRKCRGIKDRYYLGEGRAQDLDNYDLVLFAKQIAAGMVFLGSRGIIHRDLAARNVLLDNNYVCKVTDFGMAYQNFKYGHGNAKKVADLLCLAFFTVPLAKKFLRWSYGIVLYEIVTLGGIPYDGWSEGNVVAQVTRGYKLPKPDHVDDKL